MSSVPSDSDIRVRLDECPNILPRISFDGRFIGDILPITYFASVLELVDSATILLKHGKLFDIYPLMRTLQELSVDISNMADDINYFRCILLDHEQNWKKLLQQAQSGNRFLSSIASVEDLNEQIQLRNKTMKELRSEGGEFLTVEKNFERPIDWTNIGQSTDSNRCTPTLLCNHQ